MRSKEEIMKEIAGTQDSLAAQSANEYLFLEVLIDIRDQLSLFHAPDKLKIHCENLSEVIKDYGALLDKIRSEK